MAYTFFPKSSTEITTTLKSSDKNKVADIVNVFNNLSKKYPKAESPINIDPGNISKININRSLQGDVDLAVLKRETKISKITMKFGSGSAGNRGVGNRGNLFEEQFAQDIRTWWAGETVKDAKNLEVIEGIAKEYKLNKHKKIEVKDVGELNNKRPLVFTPSILISSKIPVSGNDLGKIVTDITIENDNKEPIVYLSLKMGGTVTFFNVGIRTVLTPVEIKSAKIKNKDGLKLLSMFNIKPDVFCGVFNGHLKKGYSEDVWPKMSSVQKTALQNFLESGIGHGYHVVHKLSNEIKSIKVDKKYMISAATPMSCVIHYGGKTGTGKRIDMEIETGKYILKLNIRDTQGGDGYPTRMMCDFTSK